ncbi:ATP-binding cassette domain-containing protein [Roseateles sp. DB2]|uniref:ATP-binding cassette domain-containing protein n=1 Tax=Roseateles sp. DB2 TaxID=3453717 RepID=UPI003EE9107D
MMPSPDKIAELHWIAQRCKGLYPALPSPRPALLASLLEAAAAQAQGAAAASAPSAPSGPSAPSVPVAAVTALFADMSLGAPVWRPLPLLDALPMVGHVPGLGWGVIAGQAVGGAWRFESAQGLQLLEPAQLTSGEPACFAAILPAAAPRRPHSPTAAALFRMAFGQGWPLFGVAAAAALCANLLALGGSLYSMQVYDRVIPTQGLSTLLVLTVGVLVAALMELAIKLMRSRLIEEAMKRIDLTVSQAIFERLTRIRMDQFPRSVGSLSAQIRSYESIRAFLAAATMYVAADAPFALLFLLAIFAVGGAEMAAVPLAFAAVALVVGLIYRRRIAAHAERGISVANRKFGLLVETIENAESLKAYGGRARQTANWRALNAATVEEDAAVRHHSEHAGYIAAFIQQASYVAVVGLGAYIASSSGRLTVGALIACSILAGRVLAPVAALPGLIVQWAQARTSLDNLEKVFALEQDNEGVDRPLQPERIRGAYELADLRFTYPGRPETLHVRQLSIRPGEKLAVIGPTGAGKTTLLKVLAGLYRAQSGRALLDGLDLQQIDRELLSERLAFLPQQARLFTGTLRENLLLGVATLPSEAELLDVCHRTGVGEIISRHPQGLDLPIVEGGEGLSGGQKQLVAFTRAVLSSPDVWLLDEPTAWMDEHSEARCLAVLRERMRQDQTLVLVTHKPALLSLVDRVLILGERGIVLDGGRAELAKRLQQAVAEALPLGSSTAVGSSEIGASA